MEAVFLIVPLLIVLVVVGQFVNGAMDRSRISSYVASLGGEYLAAHWSPFGPGWYGEKSDRIYRVQYRDRDGNEHSVYCKTSLWSGVYFTEDQIIGQSFIQRQNRESLLDENRRLRQEIARLKRLLGEE